MQRCRICLAEHLTSLEAWFRVFPLHDRGERPEPMDLEGVMALLEPPKRARRRKLAK